MHSRHFDIDLLYGQPKRCKKSQEAAALGEPKVPA